MITMTAGLKQRTVVRLVYDLQITASINSVARAFKIPVTLVAKPLTPLAPVPST